jgi:DNA-binding transcriptional MocR family regulator
MELIIDRDSNSPAYEQIRRQIRQLVEDGLLAAGTRLPSVRDLAKKLGVSVKTVRTAYDELAAESIVETRHGSGTFVSSTPAVAMGTNLRTREEMGSQLSELPPMRWEPYDFKSDFFMMPWAHNVRKLIRFTMASPDPALFPFDRIKQVATNMLWDPQEFFFDRGHPQGYQPLVEYLEREMALAGVPMAQGENDIIIAGGFQRALSIILDLVLRPGQKVAIESPSYTGLLNLLLSKRIDYEAIPIDAHGMDTEYLASVLQQGEVKAIITIPTYHNPTGIVMSKERREHIIRLAAKHRIPIIEDDWGRHLRYEGEAPPPLKALDPGGYVIHIGTFSKCFLPGLRIGWVTSPAALGIPLVRFKAGADAGDSYFLQALLHEMIIKGYFIKHVRKSTKEYKRRRNVMCKTLEQYLPAGCSFHTPSGGLTIWLTLPKQIMSLPLLTLARKEGIEFLPAAFVMPNRLDSSALRLSFSRNEPEKIQYGVKILCELITECINNPSLLDSGATTFKDLQR